MSLSRTCIKSGALLALLISEVAAADEAKPAPTAEAPAIAERATPTPPATTDKKPTVRTYSSVTVVSDPSQVPRLPSRIANPATGGRATGAAGSLVGERPPREEHGAVNSDRARVESVRELRQEIQEMRRGLRQEDAPSSDKRAAPGAHTVEPHTVPVDRATERLRERISEQRERNREHTHGHDTSR